MRSFAPRLLLAAATATTVLVPVGASAADVTAPTAPTGLTATTSGSGVSLKWVASADRDVVDYRVLRATRSDLSDSARVDPRRPDDTSTSFVDATTEEGRTYYYFVKAVDASGNVSKRSGTASTTAGTTTPTTTAPPTTTTTTPISSTCVATIDVPQNGTDVTSQIASKINALPDGAVARFAPGGRYRVEGTIVIKNHRNLTIDGCGAEFYRDTDANGGARMWQFTEETNLTVTNMSVRGPNRDAGPSDTFVGSKEGGHAYALIGVTGGTFTKLRASQVYGDGMNVRDNGGTGTRTTGVVIRDAELTSAGRQGIAVTNADDVLIENSYIGGSRLKNFDVEPEEGKMVRRVTFRNNRVGPSGSYAWGANGRDNATVEDIAVVNNTLIDNDMRWGFTSGNPSTKPWKRFTISGNTSTKVARECYLTANNGPACGNPVMILRGVSDLVVTNNRQPLSSGQTFLSTTGSTDLTIAGNAH